MRHARPYYSKNGVAPLAYVPDISFASTLIEMAGTNRSRNAWHAA
jgi:hypothetical protein